MQRLLLGLAVLFCANEARAQSTLTIVDADSDRPFDVSLVDHSGRGQRCTLPAAGGCRLSLSPGPLQLDLESGGRSRAQTLLLPPGDARLQLDYQKPTLGYVGIGLLGGSAVFTGLTILLFAQVHEGAEPIGALLAAFTGAVTGCAAVVLLVVGVVLTVTGFVRAGPTAELVPSTEAPLPKENGPLIPAAPQSWQGPQNAF